MWKILRNYNSKKMIDVTGDKTISDYICVIRPVVAKTGCTSMDGELSGGQVLHSNIEMPPLIYD